MSERVTRQQVEVAASGDGKLRVTQLVVEILAAANQILELTASNTIALTQSASATCVCSRAADNTLALSDETDRVIQLQPLPMRVTRQQVETIASGIGVVRVTNFGIEVLSEYVIPISLNFPTSYATQAEGEDYFAQRLHTQGWPSATPVDRHKALILATRLIDTLNFKDHKHTVYTLLDEADCGQNIGNALDNECITKEELQEANLAQPLEFPRGADTEVPQDIKDASLEIAEALLDGKDPELELEQLSVFNHLAYSFSAAHERRYVPVEHLINLIPSAVAWSWIKPFLVDDEAIKITRIT